MLSLKNSLSFAGLVVVSSAGPALAQGYVDVDADIDAKPSMYSYAWRDATLDSQIGIGFNIGGGVAGFTESAVRDVVDSDVSGLWSARMTLGTHTPLGVDISYIGTAVDLTAPTGAQGTLLGTAVEGALRWNMLPHYEWNPYVFGGAGWQRYDVTDAVVSRSANGISDQEDLAVFPLGAGLSYRDLSGITFDVRGTLRVAEDSELVATATGGNADLHTWDASGTLGYEF